MLAGAGLSKLAGAAPMVAMVEAIGAILAHLAVRRTPCTAPARPRAGLLVVALVRREEIARPIPQLHR